MNFNTSVTEAYKKLYESRDDPTNPLHNHNNPELLAKWGADPSTLETQILCHKNGTPLDNGKSVRRWAGPTSPTASVSSGNGQRPWRSSLPKPPTSG